MKWIKTHELTAVTFPLACPHKRRTPVYPSRQAVIRELLSRGPSWDNGSARAFQPGQPHGLCSDTQAGKSLQCSGREFATKSPFSASRRTHSLFSLPGGQASRFNQKLTGFLLYKPQKRKKVPLLDTLVTSIRLLDVGNASEVHRPAPAAHVPPGFPLEKVQPKIEPAGNNPLL